MNRVGWLEWEGAEDLRSRSRWWLALLSSAGEERGAWFMEAMLLRVSVQRENTPVSGTPHIPCSQGFPYANTLAFMKVSVFC